MLTKDIWENIRVRLEFILTVNLMECTDSTLKNYNFLLKRYLKPALFPTKRK
nr:hypothetical protein [uncultured archaeon]